MWMKFNLEAEQVGDIQAPIFEENPPQMSIPDVWYRCMYALIMLIACVIEHSWWKYFCSEEVLLFRIVAGIGITYNCCGLR